MKGLQSFLLPYVVGGSPDNSNSSDARGLASEENPIALGQVLGLHVLRSHVDTEAALEGRIAHGTSLRPQTVFLIFTAAVMLGEAE